MNPLFVRVLPDGVQVDTASNEAYLIRDGTWVVHKLNRNSVEKLSSSAEFGCHMGRISTISEVYITNTSKMRSP